jgi:hypothetical protein
MSYPFFDDFILDSIVLFVSMFLVVVSIGIAVYVGQIVYALWRAFLDKLRKKNKQNE